MKKYTYKADVNKWEPEYNYYEADYKEQEVYGFGLFWPRLTVCIFFILVNVTWFITSCFIANHFSANGFLCILFCAIGCTIPTLTVIWWVPASISYFDQLEYFIEEETVKPARIRAKQNYEERRAEFIKFNKEHPEASLARDYAEGRLSTQDFCEKIKAFEPEKQKELFELVDKYKKYRKKLNVIN